MHTVAELIAKLDLEPHPEGGYFKETYRSEGLITEESLANEFDGQRNYSTGIYYLLQSEDFSAFHKIRQDEMWHFYLGSAIEITMISTAGKLSKISLGQDIANGDMLQFVIPKNYWFAAKVTSSNSYGLAGCTVAPGFDFRDFELANRNELIKLFPEHTNSIIALTRA